MKSKSFMLMILSMGFGLIAAIGISQVMGRSSSEGAPVTEMGTVLVAADDWDIKTHLTEEHVKLENWPLSIIPEDAVTTIEEIADMGSLTRLSKGMPIVKSTIVPVKLLGRLDIPEGLKVVAIKVSGDDLIGGLLSAGDKVDVIGLFKKRVNGETQTSTRTFLKALRVFSVNNEMAARENRTEGGSSSSAVVGVLVTEKQSEDIVYVQKTGEIKLVLRGDHVSTDDIVQDLSDIMKWDTEEPEKEEAEPGAPPKTNLLSMFGNNKSDQRSSGSMIIWEGNQPRKVSFKNGSIPTNVTEAPFPPSQGRSDNEPADEDTAAEFDGSTEIDRGIEQDQYRDH
ncbi:MAG: Flp pilus assembly protein CpaB [Mariniblastus sp.]|jgi:Flp pilus assembly protein CpaB